MGEVRWRFEIQYGPEGEANYAWVYDETGRMICTAKTHDAAKIVEAVNDTLRSLAGYKDKERQR